MLRNLKIKNRGLRACLAALVVFLTATGFALTQAQTQTETINCVGGFTEEAIIAPALLTSLTTVENPVIPKDKVTGQPILRDDLLEYVASLPAAIRLGKALFWDMQVGSDNATACATCHASAGQDLRTRNQLNPGPNASWDDALSANADVGPASYPFTLPGERDTDNITGSQGVRKMTFGGISKSGAESVSSVADPVFNVNGANVRQVTGRNAPASVNAVFNGRLFHDGRAQPEFNGVNPFGSRDTSARVWMVSPVGPTQMNILIHDASLASQAVGPVLNDVEMSAKGRTWPDLGKKLMNKQPLALQHVDPTDSVLGAYADPSLGLTTTYKAMVQAAFKPKWWSWSKNITINKKSYTVMEANMSLFWGISVMLYQATLVSDQTPIDRYLVKKALFDPNAAAELDGVAARITADYGVAVTSTDIINGLKLFELPPPPSPAPNGFGCMLCHVGAALTSASALNLTHGIEVDDIAFVNAGFDQRMERMFWRLPPLTPGTDQITLDPMAWTVTEYNTRTPEVPPADVPLAVYDTGYYNIGVRPIADDVGAAAIGPDNKPWSIVRYLQQTFANTDFIKVPGATVNCGATLVKNSTGYPLLSGSLRKTERTFVDGAFKTPALRNAELTGPYFHNGGKASLFQVMELYDDGGDFDTATKAPLIRPLGMTETQMRDVIAFLIALTDERVRWERAPFDHPSIAIPNGDSAPGVDNLIQIPAVGAGGGSPLQRFLNLNPFHAQ